MSVALLIESTIEGGKAQSLVTEHGNFYRTSTGARGRGEAWKIGNHTGANPAVTKIVGMTVQPADERDLRIGKVTGLATKLVSIEPVMDTYPEGFDHHLNAVANLTEAVKSQSQELVSPYFRSHVVLFGGTGQVTSAPIFSAPAPVMEYAPITQVERPVMVGAAPVTELAIIPPIEIAESYIQRKIIGKVTEFDTYDVAMRDHKNILIKGHAGSGKTMSVVAYAAKRGYRYYNISSHAGVDTTQLFGKWNPQPDGSLRWVDGAVTHLVRNGGVLLINEINFLPERISTALFSLLDDRREIQLADKDGEVIKAHPELLILGDMNPNYRGTRPLNQAWADRFSMVLEFPYDPSIEAKLITNKAVLDMAAKLRQQFDNDELETPVSTRGLCAFMFNMDTLGYDFAVYSYLNKFASHEQQAVKLVFDTYSENIKQNQNNFASVDNYINNSVEGL
jgi:nitric oxide reductase NorQ protein